MQKERMKTNVSSKKCVIGSLIDLMWWQFVFSYTFSVLARIKDNDLNQIFGNLWLDLKLNLPLYSRGITELDRPPSSA